MAVQTSELNMKTRILLLLATLAPATGLLLTSTATVALAAESNLQNTFDVSPGGKLVVAVDRGSVDVKTTEASQVAIEVTRRLDQFTDAQAAEVFNDHVVTFSHTGNEVRVHAEFKTKPAGRSNDKRSRLQVRYQISVPRQFEVDLKTAGGGIAVADLTGAVRAHTSAGSLKLGRIDGTVWGHTSGGSITMAGGTRAAVLKTSAGNIEIGEAGADVTAESSGGSITIKKAAGNLDARTSAGGIEIGQAGGEVLAKTSGGSIRVGKAAGKLVVRTSAGNLEIEDAPGPIEAHTSGGSIRAVLRRQPLGACKFTTSAGSITVSVPETIAVNLDAKTSAGQVTTDLPVTTVVRGEARRNHVQGQINGGGPALVLQSRGGSVHLKKL
jgi:DUF4097 and DUF4098 domain-containing protein YvlB